MALKLKERSILPGFGLTLGFTLVYLCLIVLIPLGAMVLKTSQLSLKQFWDVVTDERAVASYKVTFGTALAAALLNAVFGFVTAWTLVRYNFFGKKIVDAMVDLPFALPTAVSGIALTQIYAPNGWIGQYLEKWNASGLRESLDAWYVPAYNWLHETAIVSILTWVMPATLELKAAYSPLGITIALTFIGMPFVVRTLQPTLEDLEVEVEEASASLGATRWQTFWRVIFPSVMPALLTGFSLSFARAVGEYGSVVFIAGNMPMETEITSLLIITKLEQYDYTGATALATVMLMASFVTLFVINTVQWWATRRHQGVS